MVIMEEFRDIQGYEGLYQVSNLGRVKSLGNDKTRKEKILNPSIDGNGYFHVRLYKDCKSKTTKIHQLVAISFLNHTRCGHKLVVDHINDIKTDNRLENLQIITQRENAYKTQCRYSSQYKGVYWHKVSNKWKAKITINRKQIHLGYFKCELAASAAYQNKLKEINI